MRSISRFSYLPWVDFTRIVAIFFVIVVHVSYQLVAKWGEIPFGWWMFGNIVDGASRTAVSLFFMVSGYLNLARPMPWKDYFQRRLSRILILLVTWSLIHMFLLAYTGQREYTLFSAFKAILSGTVFDHLWFMYSLFGFYLITPIFWKLLEDRQVLWFFVLLWVIFEPLTSLIDRFTGLQFAFVLPQATGYFGFYVLGYLLGTRDYTFRQSWLGLAAWLAASLFIILATWGLTASAGTLDITFYYINGFPVLIGAIGLFVFIKSSCFDHPMIRWLGTTTTGIYLMHYIIIDLVKRGLLGMKLSAIHPNPYVGVPLAAIIVFFLSSLLTWVMLHIPGLRRIVS